MTRQEYQKIFDKASKRYYEYKTLDEEATVTLDHSTMHFMNNIGYWIAVSTKENYHKADTI